MMSLGPVSKSLQDIQEGAVPFSRHSSFVFLRDRQFVF